MTPPFVDEERLAIYDSGFPTEAQVITKHKDFVDCSTYPALNWGPGTGDRRELSLDVYDKEQVYLNYVPEYSTRNSVTYFSVLSFYFAHFSLLPWLISIFPLQLPS